MESALLEKYEPFIVRCVHFHAKDNATPVYLMDDYEDRLQEARLAFLSTYRKLGYFAPDYFKLSICGALSKYIAETKSCVTIPRNQFSQHFAEFTQENLMAADHERYARTMTEPIIESIYMEQCADQIPPPGNDIVRSYLKTLHKGEAITHGSYPCSRATAYRMFDDALNQFKEIYKHAA